MQPLNATDESAGRPLCFNQEQLLISREWIERHSEALPASSTPVALTLEGRLDPAALERALNEIIRRHQALRVRFFRTRGMLAPEREARLRAFGRGIFLPGLYEQSVSEHAEIELQRLDLSDLRAPFAGEEVRNIFYEEATRRFDYSKPPLIRATLLRRGLEDHLLILVMDHAVADGWSMRLLRHELVQLYESFCSGAVHPLPRPEMQYPDYAIWQRGDESAPYFDAAAAHWKQLWERFASARIALGELPFALPAAPFVSTSFGSELMTLDPETCRAIRALSREARVTPHTFFLAVYATVLQSYVRRDRLALWSHFSNRQRAETQNTIGYFAHSHLLGIEFTRTMTAVELLHQIRTSMLAAYEHQELPLAMLWNRLHCWPRYADARLLVDYQRTDESWENQRQPSGLLIRRASVPEVAQGRFSSLGLYIKDDGEQMSLSVQYARERFPQAAVQHLAEDLRAAVGRFLAGPGERISKFVEQPRYPESSVRPSPGMGEFVRVEGDLARSWRLIPQSPVVAGAPGRSK
jgi:hypothetical protein